MGVVCYEEELPFLSPASSPCGNQAALRLVNAQGPVERDQLHGLTHAPARAKWAKLAAQRRHFAQRRHLSLASEDRRPRPRKSLVG